MAIRNPVLPYIGPVGGSLVPGRSVRITGTIHPGATRFGINLQCGPNLYPRDDVAIHISPDFSRNCVIRNTISGMNWGPEETTGHLPLSRGQPFDVNILCERDCYKVSINGHHYTDFIHRMPFERVTHFSVDGDITVNSIEYFGGGYSGTHMPMPMAYPVPPGVPGHMPPPHIPHPPPPGPHGYYPPPHDYVGAHAPYPTQPYPTQPGVPYPTQSGVPYPTQPGAHYPTQPGMPYPTQPGVPHSPYTEPYKKPSVLDKAGALIAGTAIGSTVLGGNKKVLKSQKKAHKKALKYGLPIAGLGVGAYALHKASHHHHHHGHSSSSSSSSSSSEEE